MEMIGEIYRTAGDEDGGRSAAFWKLLLDTKSGFGPSEARQIAAPHCSAGGPVERTVAFTTPHLGSPDVATKGRFECPQTFLSG